MLCSTLTHSPTLVDSYAQDCTVEMSFETSPTLALLDGPAQSGVEPTAWEDDEDEDDEDFADDDEDLDLGDDDDEDFFEDDDEDVDEDEEELDDE